MKIEDTSYKIAIYEPIMNLSVVFLVILKHLNTLKLKEKKWNIRTEMACKKFNLAPALEAVDQRWSVKKVFLEISQNSQENICARVSFLINLQILAQVFFLWILRNF